MSTPKAPAPARRRRHSRGRDLISLLIAKCPVTLAIILGSATFLVHIPPLYIFLMFGALSGVLWLKHRYELHTEGNTRPVRKGLYLQGQVSWLMLVVGFTAPVKFIELLGKLFRAETPPRQDVIYIFVSLILLLLGLLWHSKVNDKLEALKEHGSSHH